MSTERGLAAVFAGPGAAAANGYCRAIAMQRAIYLGVIQRLHFVGGRSVPACSSFPCCHCSPRPICARRRISLPAQCKSPCMPPRRCRLPPTLDLPMARLISIQRCMLALPPCCCVDGWVSACGVRGLGPLYAKCRHALRNLSAVPESGSAWKPAPLPLTAAFAVAQIGFLANVRSATDARREEPDYLCCIRLKD